MSDFIDRTDLNTFVQSGNDPSFPDPPWLEVPPGSANRTIIDTVPGKYRKIAVDVLSEMNASEKAAVDAAEAAATLAANRAAATANVDAAEVQGFDLRALIETFNKRDNYTITRLEELQSALDAVKASSGPADNIRAAIPASWLATNTRTKPQTVTDYKANITAGAAVPALMATGTVILPILAAVPDGTNAPALAFSTSRPYLAFDTATDELIYWTFRLPADYASAPVLKIQWSGSASTTVTHDVTWACEVMKMTADTDGAMDSDSYDATPNTVNDAILGTTAKRIQGASLTLTNFDSGAAGDYIALKFYRDISADDLPEDAWLWAVSLEYTTT